MGNKNILYLIPTNEDQYLNFLAKEMGKYFDNLYLFNTVQFFSDHGLKKTERHIQNLITDKKIDIIISTPFAIEDPLSVEFYAALKKKVNIVFWMFDDDMYFDSCSKYYCQIADAVVTTDYFRVFAYEKLDIPAIWFFPPRPISHYYPAKIDKVIDVSFIGNCKKSDRMEYINFLAENDINVETFGIGSKNGFLEWNEFSKIMSKSKINLNFAKIDELSWINRDEPLINKIRQSKSRLIEIALTKSFCLSEYSCDLDKVFEIGKEIDVFYNKEELLEKVKFYLLSEKKRKEITENAYSCAVKNHNAGIVIPGILTKLEEILAKKNQRSSKEEILLNESFKIKLVNAMTFSMFILMKNRKIFYALELFKELFKYGFFIFVLGFYSGMTRIVENRLNKLLKNIR